MSYSRVYDKHSAILEYIKNNSKPTTKDIQRYLESTQGPISLRSIQRAIQDINFQTGAVIEKRGTRPNYYYELVEEDPTEQQPLLFSYLEHSRLADIFKRELTDSNSAEQIFYPDIPMSKGLNHIPDLVRAIKDRKLVKFEYHKWKEDGEALITQRKVEPAFLKEHKRRWYLICQEVGGNKFISFGLDRIENLEVTSISFKPSKKDDPRKKYDNVIGLFEAEETPLDIEIWTTKHNANYLRTLPLHHSQKEIGPKHNGIVFSICVVPNFELYQTVAYNLENLKILSPESVKKEMSDKLTRILASYR